jgi:hypothetical protein
MEKLQEIVRVVGRKRIKKIEVFNDQGASNRGSLYYKFYRGLKEGKFNSDEDAAKQLFGTDPADKKYLMLKSRVRTRLMNTLFFLEKSNSRYEQAIYKCNRNLVAAKYLLLNGARVSGESLLRTTAHEAEKFGLTDIAVSCLRVLRYRASFSGNETEFKRLNQRFKELQGILDAEYLAEEYYQLITIPYVKSLSVRPELAKQAFQYLKEIEGLRKKDTSFELEMHYFRLKVMAHQIAIQHRHVISTCLDAEKFLHKNKHIAQNIRFGEFAFYRMIAYMHLGEYEAGKDTANLALKYYQKGSMNWMIFEEYYFLLAMHTGNYAKAAEIYAEVVGHARFQQLDETRREKWRIFEAFLKYMAKDALDEELHLKDDQSRFNIFKFLNDVPTFSRDKRGLNISILILQVLFLLDRGDFGGIIQRAEALKIYASRYLKQDENFRSNCFLKMVLMMEKRDFDFDSTSKTTEKYYNKLRNSALNYQNGNVANIEVIPYEQLWGTILEKLRTLGAQGKRIGDRPY